MKLPELIDFCGEIAKTVSGSLARLLDTKQIYIGTYIPPSLDNISHVLHTRAQLMYNVHHMIRHYNELSKMRGSLEIVNSSIGYTTIIDLESLADQYHTAHIISGLEGFRKALGASFIIVQNCLSVVPEEDGEFYVSSIEGSVVMPSQIGKILDYIGQAVRMQYIENFGFTKKPMLLSNILKDSEFIAKIKAIGEDKKIAESAEYGADIEKKATDLFEHWGDIVVCRDVPYSAEPYRLGIEAAEVLRNGDIRVMILPDILNAAYEKLVLAEALVDVRATQVADFKKTGFTPQEFIAIDGAGDCMRDSLARLSLAYNEAVRKLSMEAREGEILPGLLHALSINKADCMRCADSLGAVPIHIKFLADLMDKIIALHECAASGAAGSLRIIMETVPEVLKQGMEGIEESAAGVRKEYSASLATFPPLEEAHDAALRELDRVKLEYEEARRPYKRIMDTLVRDISCAKVIVMEILDEIASYTDRDTSAEVEEFSIVAESYGGGGGAAAAAAYAPPFQAHDRNADFLRYVREKINAFPPSPLCYVEKIEALQARAAYAASVRARAPAHTTASTPDDSAPGGGYYSVEENLQDAPAYDARSRSALGEAHGVAGDE